MIYFTVATHLGHENVIRFCSRLFLFFASILGIFIML